MYDADIDMDMEVPIDSLSTAVSTSGKGKRKGSANDDDARPSKARTLGGDRQKETVVVREIGGGSSSGLPGRIWSDHHVVPALPVPPLLNSLSVKVEGSDDMLEAENSEGDSMFFLRSPASFPLLIRCVIDPTEVMLLSGKQTQWLDFLPSRVLAMTATASFAAVAMEDGSVIVYSSTGRRYICFFSLFK